MTIHSELEALNASEPNYATEFVDCLLQYAVSLGCSDVHLQPQVDGLAVYWRLDGVLQLVGTYSTGEAADIVTRLKVLAGLLTYQSDVPQEGRLLESVSGIDMRVSTIPTVFGERAVIRLFGSAAELQELRQLALPDDVSSALKVMLGETSGVILVTGPAGSGKTTTAYACLRHLVAKGGGGRSIVSLEDPVEVVVPGVAQSQTNETVGFDLHSGLKSMLRQDPEVIFIGEIRDRRTAEVAFQAALTGQLVITTFHAGSAAEAASRLIEMGIEPYVLRSALLGIVCQRLARRVCGCGKTTSDPELSLGFAAQSDQTKGEATVAITIAKGCDACKHTGYMGRTVLAEMLSAKQAAVGKAILGRQDTAMIEQLAVENGMTTIWEQAQRLVQIGTTTPQEARRVLGWRDHNSSNDNRAVEADSK